MDMTRAMDFNYKTSIFHFPTKYICIALKNMQKCDVENDLLKMSISKKGGTLCTANSLVVGAHLSYLESTDRAAKEALCICDDI